MFGPIPDDAAGATPIPEDVRPIPGEVYEPPTKQIGRRIARRKTGSREYYETLTEVYPAAAHRPYAKLFLALLSPNRVGTSPDGDDEVLIDGHTLAACMMREREYANGNLRDEEATGQFLDDFEANALPGFTWTEAEEGRCRAVSLEHLDDVLDGRVRRARAKDRRTPAHELEDRVWLDTGAAFSDSSKSRERRRIREAMDGYSRYAPTPLTGRLFRYMLSVPTHAFSRVEGHLPAAWEVVPTLKKERAREDAEEALRAIADFPEQLYGFSEYSPRLFGRGFGLATVPTDIRRALLPECVELDLASSQLALASREWGCPDLYDFLDGSLVTGESIWGVLIDHVGLPKTDASKRALKRGVYGLVYGAGEDRIVTDIREEYADLTGREVPETATDSFLSHPFVREVYEARERELEIVRERGYVTDCFGRTLVHGRLEYGDGKKRRVSGADAARSLLAQKMQALELWLLEPVIEMAEREAEKGNGAEFRILVWQHDGCSVWYRRPGRRSLYEGRIIGAVNARARGRGYPTRLEAKWTGPDVE